MLFGTRQPLRRAKRSDLARLERLANAIRYTPVDYRGGELRTCTGMRRQLTSRGRYLITAGQYGGLRYSVEQPPLLPVLLSSYLCCSTVLRWLIGTLPITVLWGLRLSSLTPIPEGYWEGEGRRGEGDQPQAKFQKLWFTLIDNPSQPPCQPPHTSAIPAVPSECLRCIHFVSPAVRGDWSSSGQDQGC